MLLGGWPQTWWEFHKIMPPLAGRHQVIAVDLRGMGVPGLPERLLAGRSRELIDWMCDYLIEDPASIGDRDRDVYARAYSTPDAIRAGNAWYRAFGQDIADEKAYGKVTVPLLGLGGGEGGHMLLQAVLPDKGHRCRGGARAGQWPLHP